MIPAAAFAAPIASSSCPTRMCWSWLPANERAVRISSANDTRNSPTAAGTSASVSCHGGVGTLSRAARRGCPRPPRRRLPRSSAQEATIAPTTTISAAGSRGTRKRGGATAASAATPTATVATLTSPISRPTSTSCGIGSRASMSTPEQLAELPDDQHDRDAVDVADQHGPREVVGEPPSRSTQASTKQAATSSASIAASSRPRRCRRRRAPAPPRHERRHRALRADDQLPRGAEQRVRQGRQQQRVEAGHRGQPGDSA